MFASLSIYFANSMRMTAQRMYEYPYTIMNAACGMRSRLLDTKLFISILLTKSFENGDVRAFFAERYKLQNEAIDILRARYLGPAEDVEALRRAMDDLVAVQEEAVRFAEARTEEEILAFIAASVYPRYDAVGARLDTIIKFADAKVYSLLEHSKYIAVISMGTAVLLAILIVFLMILYANRIEQKIIANLSVRERELRDALLLAQKANNAKMDFFSRMSHEIRTLMNVIIGMTTITGTHLDDHNRLEDCLAKIASSSRHLLSLTNDVIDMSKIEEGKLKISREPFRLQQLTESIISVVYSQTRGRGKKFECDVRGASEEIFIGDFMRVNQILLNLLSNAVKFTPVGGRIRLEIRQIDRKSGEADL